jgi:hypothetical protein
VIKMTYRTGSQVNVAQLLQTYLANDPNILASTTTLISNTLSYDTALAFLVEPSVEQPRMENPPTQICLISREGSGRESRFINATLGRVISNVRLDLIAKAGDVPASGSAVSRLEDLLGKVQDAMWRLNSGSYGPILWALKNSERFLAVPTPNIGRAQLSYRLCYWLYWA